MALQKNQPQRRPRFEYTFEVLDIQTEEQVGTLTLKAVGFRDAEAEVDAWLDEHPDCIIGRYTHKPLPIQQQHWTIER
jgi:hypothetical protein